MHHNPSPAKVKKTVPVADVVISNTLPMKLGLRKRLSKDNISFQITPSNYHVLIYKKVLIQVYDAQKSSNEPIDKLLEFTNKNREKFELIIDIFSFIDFTDTFEEEARLLKKNYSNLGQTINYR